MRRGPVAQRNGGEGSADASACRQPDAAADQIQTSGVDDEPDEDPRPPRPHRLAAADVARAFGHPDQHDVHPPVVAHRQTDAGGTPKTVVIMARIEATNLRTASRGISSKSAGRPQAGRTSNSGGSLQRESVQNPRCESLEVTAHLRGMLGEVLSADLNRAAGCGDIAAE